MTSPSINTPPATLTLPQNPSNNQLSTPPPANPQEHSTAQHVDDLFKKWTRYISNKLKSKKSDRKTEKENDDGTPRLDLSQPVEIQQSVVVVDLDKEDNVGARSEKYTKKGDGEETELSFGTLDHESL